KRLNGVFESVHGLLLTERDGDVVPAQEGKDAPVEHVRRRIGRILLRERASIEQRGNPAFLVKALEWLEREPSALRELVLACGEIKANEETRSFALRHRRNPSRLQWKRVAIRMNVDPPASCRSFELLDLDAVSPAVAGCLEPLVTLPREIVLI